MLQGPEASSDSLHASQQLQHVEPQTVQPPVVPSIMSTESSASQTGSRRTLSSYSIRRADSNPPKASFNLDKSAQCLSSTPELPETDNVQLKKLLPVVERCFAQGKFENAISFAEKQLKMTEGHAEELKKVIQYLETIIFLSKLNLGQHECLARLPSENREEFIFWHLEIAKAAANSASPINSSRDLELLCLRRAADAGSPKAKLDLSAQLLLPAKEKAFAFQFDEALKWMCSLPCQEIERLKPLTNDQTVVKHIADFLSSPSEENRDHLASLLMTHEDPNVRQLAPMLYLKEIFGDIDTEKADSTLKSLEKDCAAKGTKTGDSARFLFDYWTAECNWVKGDEHLAEKTLNKLSRNDFAPAQQRLAELYLVSGTPQQREILLVSLLKPEMKPWIRFCPDLAYALYLCSRKLPESTQMQRHDQVQLMSTCLSHCHSDARARELYPLCKDSIRSVDDWRAAGTAEAKPFPERALALLEDWQYSCDPQTLVFTHLVQVNNHGSGDEALIESALSSDRLATLYRLASLNHCSASLSKEAVFEELLKTVGRKSHLLKRWHHEHAFFNSFWYDLKNHYSYFSLAETSLHLALAIASDLGISPKDYGHIYESLSKLALEQGDTAAFKNFSRQYQAANQSDRMRRRHAHSKQEDRKDPQDHRVLLGELPLHYSELCKMQVVTHHPLDAPIKGQELLRIFESLKDEQNPAILKVWLDKTQSLFTYSSRHIDREIFLKLIKAMDTLIVRTHSLTQNHLSCAQTILEKRLAELDRQSMTLSKEASELEQKAVQCFGPLARRNELYHFKLPSSFPNPCHQHAMERSLESEQPPAQVLRVAEQCLQYEDSDPLALTLRAIAHLSSVPRRLEAQTRQLLTQLLEKIKDQQQKFEKLEHELKGQQLQGLCSYIEEHEGEDTSALAEDLEVRLTEETEQAADSLAKSMHMGLHKKDKAFFSKLHQSSQTSLQAHVNYLVSTLMEEPAMAAEWIRALHAQGVHTLTPQESEQIIENHSGHQKPLARLIVTFLNGDPCKEYVLGQAKNKSVKDREKIKLLCLSLGLGVLSKEEARPLVKHFSPGAPERASLRAWVANDKNELPTEQQCILASERFAPDIYLTMGSRLVEFRDFSSAYNALLKKSTYSKTTGPYLLAMLAWHHLKPENTKTDIVAELCQSAERLHVEAQCRLLDWCLLNPDTDSGVKSECYRYLIAPFIGHTEERGLYQGIAQYTGTGFRANEEAGLAKMRQAISEGSFLPAARLILLIEKDCLPASLHQELKPAYSLAQQLTDIPDALALSLPPADIALLINHLKACISADASQALLMGKAITQLEETLARWQGISPKPLAIKAAPVEDHAKILREKKEQDLIRQLTLSVYKPGSDKKQIPCLLHQLKVLQGDAYPGFSEKACAKLIEHLPLDSEESSERAIELFSSVQSVSVKQEIMEGCLGDFLLDCFLLPEAPLPDCRRKALVHMLPENLEVDSSFSDALLKLADALPSDPEQLSSKELRVVEKFGEASLTRTVEVASALQHPDLIIAAIRNRRASPDRLLKKLTGKISGEERKACLAICYRIATESPSSLKSIFFQHPALSAKDKLGIFRLLPAEHSRRLGTPVNLAVIGQQALVELEQELYSRHHALSNARQLNSNGQKYNLEEMLKIYLSLLKHGDIQLAMSIRGKMIAEAQRILSEPLQKWMGDRSRWLATAALALQQ
ncbi:hypothetical protein [Endozoicomonas arenosclerae]|uniref:hypothetical protein n=1 Tax=Endozoicomonas arenosclerae TaxID=1633495 RepID=UPI0007830F0D|nr:hypothetical protein [Endozoicomonas arenosclerae]